MNIKNDLILTKISNFDLLKFFFLHDYFLCVKASNIFTQKRVLYQLDVGAYPSLLKTGKNPNVDLLRNICL